MGRFGRLGAEAFDELLGFLDLLALGVVGFDFDLFTKLRLGEVVGVVSCVFFGLTVSEGDGALGKCIEQCQVVGDDDDGARVVEEVLLHPCLRIDIEVVGGLVKQQHGGLLEEELGHGDTHLPATRKLSAVTGEVTLLKAEA